MGRLTGAWLRGGVSAGALSLALAWGAPERLAAQTPAAEASYGTLRGVVTDQASGVTLAGARVTLEELDARRTSDRGGAFDFGGVAPGRYTLRVEYLGLPVQTFTAEVAAGQPTELSAALGQPRESQDGTQVGELVVTATVNETTKKLNQERAAPALTEIAAASTASEFPDRNLGEVLQRLTGTFVDRNGTGEGNILLIRGINAANNLVLVEGVRLPSGRPDGRTPNLATISPDVIESVEVRKVFTPDLPGDFFGGYANVRQRSAFDRQGPFLSTSLATGYRSTSNGADIQAVVQGSTRLTDTLGVAAAFAYDERGASYDQYNITRNPNDAPGIAATLPSAVQYRTNDSQIIRYSGNFSLDFEPGETARYYLRAFANSGKEKNDDQRLNLFFPAPALPGSTALAGGFAAVVPELERIRADRPERFVNLVAGGENKLAGWDLAYSVGYNRLEAEATNTVRFGARGGPAAGGVQYAFRDPEEPTITLGNPGLLTNAAAYGAVVAPSTNLGLVEEDQYVAQVHLGRTFQLGEATFELKGGLRYDERQREVDNGGAQNYAPIPNAGLYIVPGPRDRFRGQFDLPLNLYAGALMDAFPLPSPERPPSDPNYLPSIAADFSGEDKITAGYLMGTYARGPLQVIVGARYEQTKTDGTNIAIDRLRFRPTDPDPLDADPSDGVAPRRLSGKYDRWLPALVLRYEPRDDMLLRASITKSYARPTIAQIFAGELVNPGAVGTQDRAVSRGNPDLTPQDALNIDASLDWYGGDATTLRIGAFYKQIEKVFFTASFTEPNPNGGTDFVTQPRNGGDAWISGIEAGAIQRLDFLPGAASRLSVEANLAFAWSEQEVLGANGQVVRETDLEQSYGFIGNASLVYRDDWGYLRLAYRHSGKRLNTIDVNPNGGFNDAFRAPSNGLDLDVALNLTRNISAFFEARNLTNEVEVVEYIGSSKDAVTRAQYGGWSVGGGVRVRIF